MQWRKEFSVRPLLPKEFQYFQELFQRQMPFWVEGHGGVGRRVGLGYEEKGFRVRFISFH